MIAILLAALSAAAAVQAEAPRPSFACAQAAGAAERFVCTDVELARLDRIVADLYAETKSLTLNDMQAEAVTKDQRAWVAKRNRCTTTLCVRDAYLRRVGELAAPLAPN